MKIINRYLAFVAVLALLFTSCSKEESASPVNDPDVQSVDLTFGAMLNDLSNRAMASANKNHFDDVPTCLDDAEPAIARIGFSYGGNSYEVDVAILSDEQGYFTDYSEDLKIPVPNNGSVEVTLNSFRVYDGDPDDGGELIWIAPIESEEGEFDGYVDTALPFSFDVEDGTKPYIDVEVLCFDRRMANEYGYVFFDILPDVIYPLCLFVNYCDENGRHFVADYSVDLYFGTNANGIQLYDHLEEDAMATTGTNTAGNYFADPLCLVVPGPPANLPDDEPYLYLIIYPEDWAGTGNIDNTPVPVTLTWEAVEELLNSDGTTNEYLHLLIGECEDALEGDESIGGGNGGNQCNPSSPNADCDDDGISNECDPDNANWDGFDCDGDGIDNGDENQGCVNDADPSCGVDVIACDLSIGDPATNCFRAILIDGQSEAFIEIGMDTGIPIIEQSSQIGAGTFGITHTAAGIEYTFDVGTATVSEYVVEISDSSGGDVTCEDESDDNDRVEGSFTYPIFVRVTTNICDPA